MEVTIDIPDHLLHIVYAILNEQHIDHNDERTEVHIRDKTGASIDDYVMADAWADAIKNCVESAAKKVKE